MKRIISLVVVALVMAALMLAMAMPAFADQPILTGSKASHNNEGGEFGPKQGFNFGQCRKQDPAHGPGNGKSTAQLNPSYNGGADFSNSEEVTAIAESCERT